MFHSLYRLISKIIPTRRQNCYTHTRKKRKKKRNIVNIFVGFWGMLYQCWAIYRSTWICIGTVSYKILFYQLVFTVTVTEIVLWLQHAGLVVGGCACLVIFCEGECHVASKMRYFPLQISREKNAC